MALTTVSDYQVLVNKLLFFMENTQGLDRYGMQINAQIEPEDAKTMFDAYNTFNYGGSGTGVGSTIAVTTGLEQASTGYRIGREARPLIDELYPNGHGTNKTTSSNGGPILFS